MGANTSYSKSQGGVPLDKRTHTDSNYRIDGHKVVIFTENENQLKNILNSDSEKPIYLIANIGRDGAVTIHSININANHKIKMDINLKFDSKGNLIPFNGTENGSHAHEWVQLSNGNMARKPAKIGENPHLPIPKEFNSLISKAIKFNKQKNKKK